MLDKFFTLEGFPVTKVSEHYAIFPNMKGVKGPNISKSEDPLLQKFLAPRNSRKSLRT